MKYASIDDIGNSYVHYGLFDGKLTQSIFESTKLVDLTGNLLSF